MFSTFVSLPQSLFGAISYATRSLLPGTVITSSSSLDSRVQQDISTSSCNIGDQTRTSKTGGLEPFQYPSEELYSSSYEDTSSESWDTTADTASNWTETNDERSALSFRLRYHSRYVNRLQLPAQLRHLTSHWSVDNSTGSTPTRLTEDTHSTRMTANLDVYDEDDKDSNPNLLGTAYVRFPEFQEGESESEDGGKSGLKGGEGICELLHYREVYDYLSKPRSTSPQIAPSSSSAPPLERANSSPAVNQEALKVICYLLAGEARTSHTWVPAHGYQARNQSVVTVWGWEPWREMQLAENVSYRRRINLARSKGSGGGGQGGEDTSGIDKSEVRKSLGGNPRVIKTRKDSMQIDGEVDQLIANAGSRNSRREDSQDTCAFTSQIIRPKPIAKKGDPESGKISTSKNGVRGNEILKQELLSEDSYTPDIPPDLRAKIEANHNQYYSSRRHNSIPSHKPRHIKITFHNPIWAKKPTYRKTIYDCRGYDPTRRASQQHQPNSVSLREDLCEGLVPLSPQISPKTVPSSPTPSVEPAERLWHSAVQMSLATGGIAGGGKCFTKTLLSSSMVQRTTSTNKGKLQKRPHGADINASMGLRSPPQQLSPSPKRAISVTPRPGRKISTLKEDMYHGFATGGAANCISSPPMEETLTGNWEKTFSSSGSLRRLGSKLGRMVSSGQFGWIKGKGREDGFEEMERVTAGSGQVWGDEDRRPHERKAHASTSTDEPTSSYYAPASLSFEQLEQTGTVVVNRLDSMSGRGKLKKREKRGGWLLSRWMSRGRGRKERG